MVMRLDRFTGQLVSLLKQLGIYERTVIVIASDNGYSQCGYFGRGRADIGWPEDEFFRNKGPFRGGQCSVPEGGLRVAFFIHQPSKVDPGISDEPVWLIDLYPTMAELAGVEIRRPIDGHSLLALMAGRPYEFPGRRHFYWEKRDEQAIRLGPWKAYQSHPARPMELYLVEDDTHCECDLAAHYPEVVAEAERIMREDRVDHPWTTTRVRSRSASERSARRPKSRPLAGGCRGQLDPLEQSGAAFR